MWKKTHGHTHHTPDMRQLCKQNFQLFVGRLPILSSATFFCCSWDFRLWHSLFLFAWYNSLFFSLYRCIFGKQSNRFSIVPMYLNKVNTMMENNLVCFYSTWPILLHRSRYYVIWAKNRNVGRILTEDVTVIAAATAAACKRCK